MELAIHRWDAEHPSSDDGSEPPAPLYATVAAAGIEEFLTDTAIRGTGSDLLLWLTNRTPAPSIELVGDGDIAASWTQLRR